MCPIFANCVTSVVNVLLEFKRYNYGVVVDCVNVFEIKPNCILIMIENPLAFESK